MANLTRVRRTYTPGKVPTVAEMGGAGGMAINAHDGILYVALTATTVQRFFPALETDVSVTLAAAAQGTTVTLPSPFIEGSERIYVGGQRLKRGIDYTRIDSTTINIPGFTEAELLTPGSYLIVDCCFGGA